MEQEEGAKDADTVEHEVEELSAAEIDEKSDDVDIQPNLEIENDEQNEEEEMGEKSNESEGDVTEAEHVESEEELKARTTIQLEEFKFEEVNETQEKSDFGKEKEEMKEIHDEELSDEEQETKDTNKEIQEKYDDIGEKESVFTRGRGSISYEMGPRIRDVEETQLDTGEFVILEEDAPLKFYKYMDEKDEEEAQEEAVSEEEEIPIDREPYYEKHESLLKEINAERLKNNILQKKLTKFFKRRKLDHVLKETDQQFDTQEKYGKKLDAYGELTDLDYLQRTTINNELDQLKMERESKFYELDKLFDDLQNQEKDTGYGLIHTKTGKPIPDKMVERLLSRQRHQMQTVGDMRLKYIQLKNMVAEKQNAISLLDKIGENLYLMDYEQLKVENRSYMDKMEEKDEELARLRNKCQKTIQILAHMREKSAALDSDIYDLNDDLATLNHNSMEVRSNLNCLKQQRDYFRNMTNKLRDESGLLTQSELLRDMEVSIAELKTLTEELELLKDEHKIKAQQIRNIRKNIEFPPEGLIKKTQKVVSDKATHSRHLYKGRPSLHKPTLPEDAFKHLKNFRGNPTFGKFERKSQKSAIGC